jgi:hypothetical protein
MASNYEFDKNYLNDIMITEAISDGYEKEVDLHAIMIERCVNLIKNAYASIQIGDIERYIDFEFDVDEEEKYIRVKCYNIISALWFCGIFPTNCREVYIDNSLTKNNILYTFDNKKKKLIIKKILNAKK